MLVVNHLASCFSESAYVRQRKEAGLHPIDEVKRFRSFVCCLFCSICVSLIFAFELFTKEFKESFNLSSGDLSTISTVGLVFCYFTIPYAFLYEYCGPLSLFAIALVTGVAGSLLLALTIEGKIPGNTATISVFYALLNVCSGLIDVASIVTLCELFPRNRGPVVGLTKVMIGLGSSVLSVINSSFFPGNIAGFIYFIMALCVVVSVFAMFLVTLPPYIVNGWRRRGKTLEQIAELEDLQHLYHTKFVPIRRLVVAFVVTGALLVFFTVSAPITAYTRTTRGGDIVIGIIAVVLVLCFGIAAAPLRVLGGVDEPAPLPAPPLDDQYTPPREGKPSVCVMAEVTGRSAPDIQALDDDLVDTERNSEPAIDAKVDLDAPQDPRYPGTVWENIRRIDIWLILVTFTCQTALGTIVMYNGTTISIAMSGKERDEATGILYTAFLGVGSACGRIAMGLFEAFVQHQDPKSKRHYMVTIALPVAPFLETLAGVLILVLPASAILFPYILIYFGEGIFASVCALIFPCLFERDHGVYYNMSFLTTVIAVVLFNRVLFGMFIDTKYKALDFDQLHDDEKECNVRECVVVPIVVATVLTFVGGILATIVHLRYSKFVRRARALAAEMGDLVNTVEGNQQDGAAALKGEPMANNEPGTI